MLQKKSASTLAEALYNQIEGPSLNSKTIELLSQLDKDIVADVLIKYPEVTEKLLKKKTLAYAVDEEWGLDINTVRKYILTPLIQKAKELKIDLSDFKDLDKTDDIKKVSDLSQQLAQLIQNKNEAQKIVDYSKKQQNRFKKETDLTAFKEENVRKQYLAPYYNVSAKNQSGVNEYGNKYKQKNRFSKITRRKNNH